MSDKKLAKTWPDPQAKTRKKYLKKMRCFLIILEFHNVLFSEQAPPPLIAGLFFIKAPLIIVYIRGNAIREGGGALFHNYMDASLEMPIINNDYLAF